MIATFSPVQAELVEDRLMVGDDAVEPGRALDGGELPEAEGVAGDDQLGVLVLRRELAEEGDEFIGEVAMTQLPIPAEMEIADEVEHTRHKPSPTFSRFSSPAGHT